ncbi:MAG: DUF4177 domain-containing protein [Nanoarchaeota archaeon]
MKKCSQCGKELKAFESKEKFKDNTFMCKICFESWKKDQSHEQEASRKDNISKALQKNSQWEYRLITVETDRSSFVASNVKLTKVEDTLNKLGEEGWELVAAIGLQAISAGLSVHSPGTTTNVSFVFKRKV